MKIGFHIPFSGNLLRLKERIRISRGNAYQLYARSLRGVDRLGRPHALHPLKPSALRDFRLFVNGHGIAPGVVHAPYFYNLAHGPYENKAGEWVDQRVLVKEDLAWAAALGAAYYVLQPGYAKKSEPAQALRALKETLADVLADTAFEGTILMKNMAGAGTEMAGSLEEWSDLISFHPRVKGALDGARLYAAGYDFTEESGAAALDRQIQESAGWENVCVCYLTDTSRGCGSQKNQYVPVGEGSIGYEGYRALLSYSEAKNNVWLVENQPAPSYYDQSIAFLSSFSKPRRG